MGWFLLLTLTSALGIVIAAQMVRRQELDRLSQTLSNLQDAKSKGSDRARLQYPHVDLSRCIGCATCIDACPEDGVLDLIHGQAAVIHGARCVGHGLCASSCPVGAIDLTLGDLKNRQDIPALSDLFESSSTPGLFLAGEVTGYALIRTAITHGTAIVDEIAKRLEAGSARDDGVHDLLIVGAGPAGIAASLQAKHKNLRFITLEQESLGGTVSKYPRRKLVMTQPVTLPLHGRLKRTSYSKEELMDLWSELTQKYELPVKTGDEFIGLQHTDGLFEVSTKSNSYSARYVCLALGRRGTPRKLGAVGEELAKVAYSLIDAQSYRDRRILVVGGGDSAIEAALGLAEQPGNTVTLSYRKSAFFRLKAKNEARLNQAIERGLVNCIFDSQVTEIRESEVDLVVASESKGRVEKSIPNDDVFVMVGGIPPFKLLQDCGISFDPADRDEPPPLVERGTGLLRALAVAFVLSLCALSWSLTFQSWFFERDDSSSFTK